MTTWGNETKNTTSWGNNLKSDAPYDSYEFKIDDTYSLLIDDTYEFLIQTAASGTIWGNELKS